MSMEELPRPARVPMRSEAGFRRRGDARYSVNLINFSLRGCCVAPPIKVEEGERVLVRIAEIEAVHGRVAWTGALRAGVEFDRPFHSAVFDMVVGRLGTVDPRALETSAATTSAS